MIINQIKFNDDLVRLSTQKIKNPPPPFHDINTIKNVVDNMVFMELFNNSTDHTCICIIMQIIRV